jgi:hypothetical protein
MEMSLVVLHVSVLMVTSHVVKTVNVQVWNLVVFHVLAQQDKSFAANLVNV